MDENLRDRLVAELADHQEPPLGDLVLDALRQGRRLRVVRRARIAGSALTAVAVLVTGLLLGDHAVAGRQVPSASAPALTTTQSASSVITQPAGPKVPTTLAAMAYHVEQLVPGGTFGDFRRMNSDSPLDLRFSLDRGRGPGMVYLDISRVHGLCAQAVDTGSTCEAGPGGEPTEVLTDPGNCVQSTVVSVDHGNGVVVTVYVATCLLWNGTSNPPCPAALTTEEAIGIAADPSWGTRMDSTLVEAADARFPALATP